MQMTFNPQVLYCSVKQVCPIRRDEEFFKITLKQQDTPINVCKKCFDEEPTSHITIAPEMLTIPPPDGQP